MVVSPSTPQAVSFYLPDLGSMLSVLPDHGFNIHYKKIRPMSHAWITKYNQSVYGPEMRAYMDNCELELLNGHCYPYAGEDGLRATMDLHNILWLYDEFTDTQTGEDAQKSADTVFKALHNPEVADDSWLSAMMKDFKRTHIDRAGDNNAVRFIDHFCAYAQSVQREAQLRQKADVLGFGAYIAFRRDTSGVRTCFDMAEYSAGINLSNQQYEDPVFQNGFNAAMDLICFANDIYSYNKEQAVGHSGANIVTVVMRSKNLDLQGAMHFLGGYSQALIDQLVTAQNVLAARNGESGLDQARLLEAFGDWVRGNVQWSFATPRYFGKANIEAKETLLVELRASFVGAVPLN
ncbi:isoprenoid synthase domain-containing protein [Mycena polygramma]|nr:isoprenoid synthase domain-containing protein [Mycena polygramma]